LEAPVEKAPDMIWILDHSIETGNEKLLAAIGIPLERLSKKSDFVPDFDDVKLLDLDVSAQSNGGAVYGKMEELADRYGNPIQIVIDGGSDLVKGTKLFMEEKSAIVHTYDLPHKLAALLKKELQPDDDWNEFVEAVSMTGKMVRQTNMMFAAPPGLRTKARYMNAELLVMWANKISHFINNGDFSLTSDSYCLDKWILNRFKGKLTFTEFNSATTLSGCEFFGKDGFALELRRAIGERAFKANGDEIIRLSCTGRKSFELKFDWVNEFKGELEEFTQLIRIVEAAKYEVRQNGLHVKSVENFENLVGANDCLTSRASDFKVKVSEALGEESAKVPRGRSLLGSSEIIESVFGKYKTFSSKRPIKTVGEMILSIPLSLSRLTTDVIKQALETTSYKKVEDWSERMFGKSMLSKRVAAFGKKAQFSDEIYSFATD
jgi:hypothetical protein